MSILAAVFGFMEALIYVFGLSIVLSGDQSIAEMLVYALGFAAGIFLGGYIENKLALGYTTLTVNLMSMNIDLVSNLRERGFGVTVFEGMGKESVRYQLQILTKRNVEEKLINMIEQYEPNAFIISYEPRKFKGGYLLKSMKKKKKSKSIEK
jgi:uncharacterized protein YebE (UPF0316 family)